MPSPLSNQTQQNMQMDQQHMMPGQQIRSNNGTDYHKQNQQMNQPYVGQNQNSQMVYNNSMQAQVNRFGLQQPNRSMMFPQNQQPSPNSNSALISQLSTPPQGPGS